MPQKKFRNVCSTADRYLKISFISRASDWFRGPGCFSGNRYFKIAVCKNGCCRYSGKLCRNFCCEMKKKLRNFLVCWYLPRLVERQVCLPKFVFAHQSRINKAKQNIIFVRKGLWICLPPYFSVREIIPDFFFPFCLVCNPVARTRTG